MKKILLFLSFVLVLFACEDELEFGTGEENASIVGTWNLNSIRSYECGSFDVVISNIEDTTFHFNIDTVIRDSFIIDPVLGDTLGRDTYEIIFDTMYFSRMGATGYTDTASFRETDALGVGGGRLLNRYNLVFTEDTFEVNYEFDTVFFQDYVQHYVPCSSAFTFDGGGGGSYTGSIFDDSTGSGSLSWSDLGQNVFNICLDGDCKDYNVVISSNGGMSWEDPNFNTNDCNRADFAFKKMPNYIGTYAWTQVKLENCFGDSDDAILYTDLVCDVDSDAPVTNTVGAVCYKLVLDCEGIGYFEITGGPNEGNVRINYAEISEGNFVANPTGNPNADKWAFTINGDVIDLNLGEVTTLEGFTCPLEVKFNKE